MVVTGIAEAGIVLTVPPACRRQPRQFGRLVNRERVQAQDVVRMRLGSRRRRGLIGMPGTGPCMGYCVGTAARPGLADARRPQRFNHLAARVRLRIATRRARGADGSVVASGAATDCRGGFGFRQALLALAPQTYCARRGEAADGVTASKPGRHG